MRKDGDDDDDMFNNKLQEKRSRESCIKNGGDEDLDYYISLKWK